MKKICKSKFQITPITITFIKLFLVVRMVIHIQLSYTAVLELGLKLEGCSMQMEIQVLSCNNYSFPWKYHKFKVKLTAEIYWLLSNPYLNKTDKFKLSTKKYKKMKKKLLFCNIYQTTFSYYL